jgi:hypothetical protein
MYILDLILKREPAINIENDAAGANSIIRLPDSREQNCNNKGIILNGVSLIVLQYNK